MKDSFTRLHAEVTTSNLTLLKAVINSLKGLKGYVVTVSTKLQS